VLQTGLRRPDVDIDQAGDLEPIRNVLMHSRDWTQHGLEKLRVTSRDLLARLKEA